MLIASKSKFFLKQLWEMNKFKRSKPQCCAFILNADFVLFLSHTS